MIKYVILDFGGVIVRPTTGHWDITPKFLELIDVSKIDKDKFTEIRKKYSDILSEKVTTMEEEVDMFYRFYSGILKDLGIPDYESISRMIAVDRTYGFDKYQLFDNIHEELSKLSSDYKLILLTDNWPCVIPYLEKYNLSGYFDRVYVSSMYGVEKKDKTFFDYPIKDYSINPSEAMFIDDNESNIDIAKEKGLNVLLMDRYGKSRSKYNIISNLDIKLYDTPTLETDRLILKRGEFSDYLKVYEYDFTKLRDINNEFDFAKLSEDDIRGFDEVFPNSYDFIVYLKDGNIPIGNIVCDRERKDLNSIEIAFNTHPDYWKNGYSFEAVVEVMKFLFSQGYDNIICGYDEGNTKSKNFGSKLGFEFYEKKDNAWYKDGVGITSYTTVLSREKFNELYGNKSK